MSPVIYFIIRESAVYSVNPKNAIGIMRMLGEDLFFDALLALALQKMTLRV